MPDIQDTLTAAELHNIRMGMRQTPRSMADHLGVNINTYYVWERTGKIPRVASVAVRLMAAQPPSTHPPAVRQRAAKAFKAKFLPGARFGSLVVVSSAPSLAGSFHRRVKVLCDCGREKTLRAATLADLTQCGPSCAASTPRDTPAPLPPPMAEGDAPELDASPEEWSAYNLRQLHESNTPTNTPADAAPDEDATTDWEAGL